MEPRRAVVLITKGKNVNCKLALQILIIGCVFDFEFTNASDGQESERDPGQASALLRGVVTDEQGIPVIGATVDTVRFDGVVTTGTKSTAGGAFVLRVPHDSNFGSAILIQDESKCLASLISTFSYNLASSKTVFRAVLKPLHATKVTVVDRDENPLADASVRLFADCGRLAEKRTDAAGQAQFQFPFDAKVDWIVAYKPGFGFDYYENYDAFPTEIRLDMPAEVKLKLDGFTSVKVKVIDTKNKPIPGVAMTPWSTETLKAEIRGESTEANSQSKDVDVQEANEFEIEDFVVTTTTN